MKKSILTALLALGLITGSSYSQTAMPISQSFSVSWSAVATSTKYQLQTRVDTGASTTDDVTGSTSKTVTKDILTGQKFYAKVRACDAIWCGDWSPEIAYTMPAKPSTPAILGIQLIITQ